MARFGKFNGAAADILENKAFLYFCFIISTISLIFFAKVGDASSTAVFLIGGYLISLFTKKMAVVLLLALVISYIYKYGVARMSRAREGMSSGSLENKIDEIMNDEKMKKFLNDNSSQKTKIENIVQSLKNLLSDLKVIVGNFIKLQNDKKFTDNATKFFTENSAYFQPKITAILSNFIEDASK